MPAPLSRRVMLLTSAGLALGGCATATAPLASSSLLAATPATLPGSHVMDLRDPASGHTWRVWLQRPEGPAPAGGYPVFYTLDGNASFALAAQLARNRASRPPVLRPDGVLVVSIGHPVDSVIDQPSRARDYTPAAPGQAPGAAQGGADVLLDFIERILRPQLAQALPLDPRRQTLFGHSFGGLMVLYTLFTRPAMFTRYAAASPSIWWNQAQVLDTCARFEAAHATAPRPFRAQLQLRAGGLENAADAATAERAAIQSERRTLARTEQLAQRLQVLQWPELAVEFTRLPGLDHGAVMAPALIDALALSQNPA